MKYITKISSKEYSLRVPFNDPLTGKQKYRRKTVKGSLRTAQEVRDALVALADSGDLKPYVKPVKPKALSDWIDPYLEYREPRVAASTFAIEKMYLENLIIPPIKEWIASGITRRILEDHIETWLLGKQRNGEPYSQASLKNRLRICLRFLKWVFRREEIDPSTLMYMELPTPTRRNATDQVRVGRALSRIEAKKFLDYFKEHYPQHYCLVFALIATGQRWGSVTALRVQDLDFKDGWITFAQSHYRGAVQEGNKTGKVVRLPLTKDLREVFEWHLKRLRNEKHVNLELGLVFPSKTFWKDSPSKGYMVAGDVRGPFRTTCKKIKIAHTTPHDLRRTFNSIQIEAGLDGTVLRSITAHSSVAMTDHYYHGSRSAKEAALGNITELLT